MNHKAKFTIHVLFKARVLLCALILAAVLLPSCGDTAPKPTPREMTPITPGPGEVHTKTLVKERSRPRVKLRRNKDGTYSWEISGDDLERIIDADARLRKSAAASTRKKVD